MKKLLFAIVLPFACFNLQAQSYEYPIAPKDSIYDVYFDTAVIYDPYQWMEDPEDPRLELWLEEQRKITRKLERRQTKAPELLGQLATLYYYTSSEIPEAYEDKYKEKDTSKYEFKYKAWWRTKDGETRDLLYRERGATNYKLLIKVKDFKRQKNDHVWIEDIVTNKTLAAISISYNGSDWKEVYFFDLETGKQLPDTLKYLREVDLIWHGNGIYYASYSPPQKGRELLDKPVGQKLCYHKLGDPQSADKVLYYNPDRTGRNQFYYGKSKEYIFINGFHNIRGKLYKTLAFSKLKKDNALFLKNILIYDNDEAISFSLELLLGDSAILSTNYGAPNGKVMIADINGTNKLSEMVPETDAVLTNVNKLGKDKIACIYRKESKNIALIYDLKGNLLKKLDFPEGKHLKYFYENKSDKEFTAFALSSFYHPDLWYDLSLKDLSFYPINKISLPYKVEDLETRYVKYISKDGTEVPMYITCNKNTILDGNNPTLLYGYGGYGATMVPEFNFNWGLWLAHGGILAVPNIRGGGAEGSDWSKQGRRLNKQNTIDDMIEAARYLINEKYTSSAKLAISGGSHGGIIAAASIIQQPDLFKTAIIEAGAFDMLRLERFTAGGGAININEFGTVNIKSDFINLSSYSPLHNLKPGEKYPNILLITGDSDDRVPPLHSYKFLATLQEKASKESLYHLYIVPGAGHGGAMTPEDWSEKFMYQYYFLFEQLGVDIY